ncbi:hypothetical protein BDZ89DRAFT_806137 [Hymenopellis radicata]|nr:hypothetical protein BDZ89DRAFT_806137 [Hymenopellis radicata]
MPDFDGTVVVMEGDVTGVAIHITHDATRFLRRAYHCNVQAMAKHRLDDQTIDCQLSVDDSVRVVWEDQSWKVFEHCAAQIIDLANSDAGRRLKREAKEEDGRAMLYKLAVAMSDSKSYWGLLFGGDGPFSFNAACRRRSPLDTVFYVPGY